MEKISRSKQYQFHGLTNGNDLTIIQSKNSNIVAFINSIVIILSDQPIKRSFELLYHVDY